MTRSTPHGRGKDDAAAAGAPARRAPTASARPDKHVAITKAATELFLAEGFDRASLDQIAQRAGVSKQTIYNHFADKEALFKAICAELTERLTIPLRQRAKAGTDLRTGLVILGEDALAMMVDPATLDLHRLVIAAAARYPELGQEIYAAGAARMIEVLAEHLTDGSRSGESAGAPLPQEAARRLAEQFIGMLRGFHQLRGLLGVARPDAAERRVYVASCVDLLLRGVGAATVSEHRTEKRIPLFGKSDAEGHDSL